MTIATRRLSTFGALFILLATLSGVSSSSASAQTTAPPTAADLFLAHFDFAISGTGDFSTTDQGNNYLQQSVYMSPSNSFGALFELRYTRSPRIGFTLNYGFARYTENYTLTDTANSPKSATSYSLGVQTQAAEYSIGYVGHFGNFLGIHPFVGAGGGVMGFRPTPGGGEGLVGESRGLVYYAVGAEAPVIGDNFGVRVQFRQQFFGAPDFNTNYLANGQRAITSQPAFGLYLKF
jgi:hypothetical protein